MSDARLDHQARAVNDNGFIRVGLGGLCCRGLVQSTERSNKITRYLLRDAAAGRNTVGDTTTPEDYGVLAKLRREKDWRQAALPGHRLLVVQPCTASQPIG